MREILFRGKETDTGKWFYGSLIDLGEDGAFIVLDKRERYEIDRETVGQYTGLQDRNGMRIFEGDILLEDFLLGEKGAVYWHKECTSFHWGNGYTLIHNDELAVVGNIHDTLS